MFPLVIEPEALKANLNTPDLLIIDLCQPQRYARLHVPGAVNVQPSELVSGVKPAVGKLPEPAQLQRLLSRIGYNPNKHIVAYDDEGGGWAGRFIWTLDVIGHQHSSYLNGGIHAWLAAELPVSQDVPEIEPTDVQISINQHFIADKQEILDNLDNPGVLIWDARSPEEYAGTKVVAARGGRIPGAVNFEWTRGMDPARHYRIREDVQSLLASAGIKGDKSIITHCQSHHRSGFTYLVGKNLGFSIKAYDGSWSEWGNDPDTPIESG